MKRLELTPFDPGNLSELDEYRHWGDPIEIDVSYHLVEGDRRGVLVIGFDGEYHFGCKGNPDAEFMYAAAVIGVKAAAPPSVIFDFRNLSYVWGDLLDLVYTAAPYPGGDQHGLAVIVGERCKEAVLSLALQFTDEPVPWIHESLESAYDFLAAHQGAGEDKLRPHQVGRSENGMTNAGETPPVAGSTPAGRDSLAAHRLGWET